MQQLDVSIRAAGSASLLGRIAHQSSELIASFDLEHRLSAFNPACAREAQRLLGVELAVGMSCDAAFGLDAVGFERARVLLEQARTGIVQLVTPFGRETSTLFELALGPLQDGSGEVDGVWAIGRNVHERETGIALERERLRTVLDVLPVGVWITEADGRFAARNHAARQIWGEDAPMSERPEDYGEDYVGWWPDGRRIASDEWGLARALRGEVSTAEEIEILAWDGKRKTVLNYALPIRRSAGAVAGAVAVNVDITERKEYERAHQFLSDASTLLGESIELETTLRKVAKLVIPYLADYCLVDVLDRDGNVRRVASAHVDPAMQPLVDELLDYSPDIRSDSIVGRVLRTAQPEFVQDARALDALAAAGGRERLASIIARLAPTSFMCLPMVSSGTTVGSILLAMSTSGRHYDARATSTGMELARRAASAVDNARHHAAEQEARREAEQASNAKSRFLATMSHELRTPLTAIIGYTELLHEQVSGPLTEQQNVQLSRIRTSAWHLVTIIDEILLFTRAEAGREQARLSVVDLVALVHESVAIIEPQARHKRLTLRASSGVDDLPIETDQGKVRQILLNLLGNAVKFTDEGGVHVEVLALDGAAEIRVHDTGPGIEPDQLDRIFDPFTQADDSNTRAKGGTGLGLTVSRRLAELLGGRLEVNSVPANGSTFTLRLPRRAVEKTGASVSWG